jgi:thiol-disulfide isomerase/thioredoxin
VERQRRARSSSRRTPAMDTRVEGRADKRVLGRRSFLGAAALTMAGAQLGGLEAGEPHELAGLAQSTEWINSPRLTAATLAGKVVLVDFWTYTCINWLRTLPYVRAWAQRYAGRLAVIGVHTPEFGFEGNPLNVRRSVQQMKIDYPVAIDNDHSIWRAFSNHVLAGPLPHRYARATSLPSLRRRRVPAVGAGHSTGCSPRRASAKPGEGLVSVEGDRGRSRGGLGQARGPPRPIWAAIGRWASRRRAAPCPIGPAPMWRPGDWRSMNGPSPLSGRWAVRTWF